MKRSIESLEQRTSTAILLSIKPHYASAILSGDKKFEYRRALHTARDLDRVILYASSPTKKVVGEFWIAAIHSMELEELWRQTREHAGVERAFFDAYFHDRTIGHALEVGACWQYPEPLDLEMAVGLRKPPQSFLLCG